MFLVRQFTVVAAEGAYYNRTERGFNRRFSPPNSDSIENNRSGDEFYLLHAYGCDLQSSWLCRRFSRSSTWMKW